MLKPTSLYWNLSKTEKKYLLGSYHFTVCSVHNKHLINIGVHFFNKGIPVTTQSFYKTIFDLTLLYIQWENLIWPDFIQLDLTLDPDPEFGSSAFLFS